jgi:pSer/pThr/pTyr-binding forkhead associated (FHA) protein
MAPDPFKNLIVRRRAGESVYSEGDLGAEMYVIQGGEVRLFRIRDGIKHEIAILEKGDFFGELSVLEGLPRTTGAEALKDAELIEINSSTFDRMIRANIEIAVRMLRKLSNRLQEANRKLESITSAAPAGRPRAAEAVDIDAPAEAPPPEPAPAAAAARGVDGDIAVPEGAFGLFILDGGRRSFPLVSGQAIIGRYDPVTGTRPEIDLTQVDINRSVSRRHARVFLQDGGCFLTEEVGALNGTLVNGRRLTPGKPHPLATGDRIALGMVALVFKAAAEKPPSRAEEPGPDRTR